MRRSQAALSSNAFFSSAVTRKQIVAGLVVLLVKNGLPVSTVHILHRLEALPSMFCSNSSRSDAD